VLVRHWEALRRRWRALRALATARRETAAHLKSLPLERILVVCYGNIYRSAFVGALLSRELAGRAEIRGAGFHRVAGRESPQRHIQMSRALGVDLSGHRSAIIEARDLEWADTVILMDRHNWTALDRMNVDAAKLLWLGALADGPLEIPDPYRLDDESAQRVLREMERATRVLVEHIRARRP
jgi:protein-tyrosine-phosphatase